jgi:hypothetical protein
MNLHYFGIFGGFIGYIITALIFWNGEGNKTTYMIIGVSAGVFIGYFIGALLQQYKRGGYVLVKKISKLNPLAGKNIKDVISAVGGYSSKQSVRLTDRNDEIGSYYTFKDGEYELILLVGADDIIIGIKKEVFQGKIMINN